MNGMLAGELLVRAVLRRESDQEIEKDAASFTGAVRGAGRVIQGTAGALGQGLEKEVGGAAGKVLRMGAEAAPTVGAVGLGAYGAEKALGNPGQRWYETQKAKVKQKLQGGQAVYNPGTGQWY